MNRFLYPNIPPLEYSGSQKKIRIKKSRLPSIWESGLVKKNINSLLIQGIP